MASQVPKAVFLAGSTAELTSALACLTGLGISDAVVFVERNISFGPVAMDPLLAAARTRHPGVRFIELALRRHSLEEAARKRGWSYFALEWRTTQSIHRQLDAACRASMGIGLKAVGAQLEEIYFTGLHDYVMVFLTACGGKKRVFYPHGFDHPRHQHAVDYAHLLRRRSLRTALGTLARQRRHLGLVDLLLGTVGHLLPGIDTVSLPFTGVDRVLTFRNDVDYVPNTVVRVPGLADTFRWLLQLSPWGELLRERKDAVRGGSLLLLLPECNCDPIWEWNRNYGAAQLRLLQTVSQATGLKRVVLKAHVRSDGSAAQWLLAFLQERQQDWQIEILSPVLAGLPVEALTLTGEFGAACSLGSCSLPPGLGFGVPHYISFEAAALFDQGWKKPYWLEYVDGDRMLIEEGICRDIARETNPAVSNVARPGSAAPATGKTPRANPAG